MKLIFLFLSVSFFSHFSMGQYRNIELQAAGLTCSLCSNAIQKALKGLPFVSGVRTELKSNMFMIDLRPGVDVNLDMISLKVEEAGFSVGKLSVEIKFDAVQIKNDAHVQSAGHIFHFLAVKPQKIEGWQKVKLMDKSFVLSAEAKKNQKLTTMNCYKTGVTADCCGMGSFPKGKRIFHVTI